MGWLRWQAREKGQVPGGSSGFTRLWPDACPKIWRMVGWQGTRRRIGWGGCACKGRISKDPCRLVRQVKEVDELTTALSQCPILSQLAVGGEPGPNGARRAGRWLSCSTFRSCQANW